LQNAVDLPALIDQYGDALYRTCCLYLKDRHLAQDALQDTFLKVYTGYASLRETQSLRPWMVRIAINVCKDYLRKSRFFIVDSEQANRGEAVRDNSALFRDNTVSAAIAALKPKYKDVILLYYYHECKQREIARILRIPEGTVAVRLKRARDQLKTKLKGWYEHEYEG